MRVLQHISAAAIGAGDAILSIMVDMQVDQRVAKRTAAAIAGDRGFGNKDGFKHSMPFCLRVGTGGAVIPAQAGIQQKENLASQTLRTGFQLALE